MLRTLRYCIIAGLLLASAACGGNAVEPADAVAADAASDSAAPDASPAGGGADVALVAEDYRYDGVPETATAGTTLSVTNASTVEVHEVLVLALGDEDRPLADLIGLPEEEQVGEFVGVLVAPPGEEGFAPGPPVVLTEPGRYALLCFIPQGADPDAYLAAAAESQGGPPDVPGGPPHVALGMSAEITVE